MTGSRGSPQNKKRKRESSSKKSKDPSFQEGIVRMVFWGGAEFPGHSPAKPMRMNSPTPRHDLFWDWHIYLSVGLVDLVSMHVNMPVPNRSCLLEEAKRIKKTEMIMIIRGWHGADRQTDSLTPIWITKKRWVISPLPSVDDFRERGGLMYPQTMDRESKTSSLITGLVRPPCGPWGSSGGSLGFAY